MCGIFGIYNFEDKNLMQRMMAKLEHRGPDQHGIFTSSRCSLGNTRLSIIDVAGGRQPIFNEDRSICLVANCEIYNHKELKIKLGKHRFYTNTDTEIIIHAYEEWGEKFVEKLEGDFAFALFDGKKLILVRDRFGVKPLFYFFDKEKFCFASEIKALLEYSKFELSMDSMQKYFTFMYIPDATPFKKIEKLLAGEMMILENDNIMKKKYWKLKIGECGFTAEVIAKKLRFLLEMATESRMMSDVPIGLMLSGGIDSASILAFMTRHSTENIKTFSVVFDEEDNRNTYNMVREFSTDHHEINLEEGHLKLLPKIVYHTDFLLADPAAVPTYLIASLAKKKVKVLLGGEGADDQLCGYSLFNRMLEGEHVLMHKRPVKRFNRYISLMRDDFSDDERTQLLGGFIDTYSFLKPFFEIRCDLSGQISNLIFDTYLPEDLMMKVDSMGMANSIEGRFPFLNLDVVAYCMGKIPSKYKINQGIEKWILREAMRDIIPNQNRLFKKKSFDVPIESIFGKDLVSRTLDLMKDIPFINLKFVEKILEENKKNRAYSRQVWSLLVFGEWYKQFEGRIS